ncbi:hypothetical protein BC834DRAFT_554096 [Gloeopeniophorella convolvens]|nr:hypothetical protein BC834DRAFT_554096 [Gloeopeniophorella convolvens]
MTFGALLQVLSVTLFASRLASAQLTYPICPNTLSWTFNSFGEGPCAVAAALQGVCNNGGEHDFSLSYFLGLKTPEVFKIPLLPKGDSYTGPNGSGDNSDLCKCNTVVYSLMSACDACQNAEWISWEQWTQNCTAIDPPTTFSNLIPSGTRVPAWAFINVTETGTWDPLLAFRVGDPMEAIPSEAGTLAAPPVPTSTQTKVPGLSSQQLGESSSHSHVAAIVGGVVGGLALIALGVVLALWRARVRRRSATRAATDVIFARRTSAMPIQETKNVDGPFADVKEVTEPERAHAV